MKNDAKPLPLTKALASNAEKVLQNKSKTKEDEFNALLDLANAAEMRGDRSLSKESFSRALAVADTCGILTDQCGVLNCLSTLELQFFDLPSAIGFCARAEGVLKHIELHDAEFIQLTYHAAISMLEASHCLLLAQYSDGDMCCSILNRNQLCDNMLLMAALIIRSKRETRFADGQYWKNVALQISQGVLDVTSLIQIADIMHHINPSDPEIFSTLDNAEKLAKEDGHHNALLHCLSMRFQYLYDAQRWEEAELCL